MTPEFWHGSLVYGNVLQKDLKNLKRRKSLFEGKVNQVYK